LIDWFYAARLSQVLWWLVCIIWTLKTVAFHSCFTGFWKLCYFVLQYELGITIIAISECRHTHKS